MYSRIFQIMSLAVLVIVLGLLTSLAGVVPGNLQPAQVATAPTVNEVFDLDTIDPVQAAALTQNLLGRGQEPDVPAERIENISGYLNVSISEGEDFVADSEMHRVLVLQNGRAEYELVTFPSDADLDRSGAVIVSGGWVVDRSYLLVDPADIAYTETGSGTTNTNYNAYVFLVSTYSDPNDITPPVHTPAEVATALFDGQIEQQLIEQSYGNVADLDGQVSEWIPMQGPGNFGCPSDDLIGTIPDEITDYVVANDISLSGYNQVMIIYNCGDYQNYLWGKASLGDMMVTIAGQDLEVAMVNAYVTGDFLIEESPMNVYVTDPAFHLSDFDALMIHEIGHTFGLNHASGLNCFLETLGEPGECSDIQYGDRFDLMGASDKPLTTHFNGLFKNAVGWIPSGDVKNVTTSGVSFLHPLEKATGLRQLTIQPIGADEPVFAVEFREGVGFEQALQHEDISANSMGIMVRDLRAPGSFRPRLLDMHPVIGNDWWADIAEQATINQGEVFSDELTGVTIEATVADRAEGVRLATVRVTLDEPIIPDCIEAVPSFTETGQFEEQSMSGDPSQNIPWFDPGLGVMYLSFSVQNNDSLYCDPSQFEMTVNFPELGITEVTTVGSIAPGQQSGFVEIVWFTSQYPDGLEEGVYTITADLLNTTTGLAAPTQTYTFIVSE